MNEPKNTTLPTNQVQPNPFQPRGKISSEDIKELVQSVSQYGILEPLVIAHTPAGYQIIAGERRWRAAKELGLEEVPVHIKKTTPRGMLEMAIVENVQRVDLSAIERAQAFQQLMRDFNFSMTDVAKKVSKSSSYISNTLRLLNLPDAIKDGLLGGLITEGHARAISGIHDESMMIECYKTILKRNSSVREAEELARRYKEKSGQQKETRGRGVQINTKEFDKWRRKLNKLFSPKSKVKLTRSKAQTKVTFIFPGGIEETQKDLNKILKLVEKK